MQQFVADTVCLVCCLQDLTAALVARVQAGPAEVVEELKTRLALKEKLLQELLSDRSRQTDEHRAQVQDLLNTLGSKDQYLQVGSRLGITTQTSEHNRKTMKITFTLFLLGLLLQAVLSD